MSTHAAVVMVAARAPLEIHQVPTIKPAEGEVRIRVEWTASTPLDLHQADAGLLVVHPQVMGSGAAGTVVEVGVGVKSLQINDKVFGFTWRSQQERAHQIYITAPEYLWGILPKSLTMQEAVTVPTNLVTVFHAVVTDLGLPLPWPRPENYVPDRAEDPILIWGGSSSCGQYALQVLRYFGYHNIFATGSKKHHELLRSFGATHTFDYNETDVVKSILVAANASQGPAFPFILDCIGSQNGSIVPIAQIAQRGTKVAILLPVIVRDASETQMPEYSMNVLTAASWTDGVEVVGVRTHFYLAVSFIHLKISIAHTP